MKGKDLCCNIYAVFPKKNPLKADGIVHVTQNWVTLGSFIEQEQYLKDEKDLKAKCSGRSSTSSL